MLVKGCFGGNRFLRVSNPCTKLLEAVLFRLDSKARGERFTVNLHIVEGRSMYSEEAQINLG